jgi:N-acetylmuramoyl-L-alanine amidase CwlA
MQIKKQLIKDTPYKIGKNNKKLYITIHETDNFSKGANAQAHANLQSNGNAREASWHYQVDDKQAIQSFTHDFQLWHGGDGKTGNGNLHSIAIEICVNSDGDYKKAVANAAELTKIIMQQEKIPIGNVVQHNKWSGKNCPRYLRTGTKGINWNDFIKLVEGELTVSQYNELLKEIKALKTENANLKSLLEGKLDKPSDNQEPDPSHAKNWEEAIKKGITVGTNPHHYITREQTITMIENALNK